MLNLGLVGLPSATAISCWLASVSSAHSSLMHTSCVRKSSTQAHAMHPALCHRCATMGYVFVVQTGLTRIPRASTLTPHPTLHPVQRAAWMAGQLCVSHMRLQPIWPQSERIEAAQSPQTVQQQAVGLSLAPPPLASQLGSSP